MFASNAEPPALPPPPFKLELTSHYASGPPWDVVNDLLKFLAGKPAFPTKVNVSKFSIKSLVFGDDFSHCLVKIRIYRMPDSYVVEFQRRSGSATTFNNLYKSWLGAEPEPLPPSVAWPPLLPQDLMPVIDMLAIPSSQAEACACLASLVCCGEVDARALLSDGGTRSKLESMSESPDAVLSYPATAILKRCY